MLTQRYFCIRYYLHTPQLWEHHFNQNSPKPQKVTMSVLYCVCCVFIMVVSVSWFSEKKHSNCCNYTSYFKAKMQQIWFRLGLRLKLCSLSLQLSSRLLLGVQRYIHLNRVKKEERKRGRKKGKEKRQSSKKKAEKEKQGKCKRDGKRRKERKGGEKGPQ